MPRRHAGYGGPLCRKLVALCGSMWLLGCGESARFESPPPKIPATEAARAEHPVALQRFASMQRQGGREHVDLVLLGDSITDSWRYEGSRVYAESFDPKRTFNMGVAGDRTEHVLWRLENGNMDGIDPKLVVLLIGTNNLGRDGPEDVVAGIESIVAWLTAERPDARILLLPLFPRGEAPDHLARPYVDAVNEHLLVEAKGWPVELLDVGPVFLETDGRLSPSVSPDALHLSELGYRRWAEAMRPSIERGLGLR